MTKLLNLLQENARLTNAQLAAMLGISEKEVADQIAKYEEQGILRGYQAIINWEEVQGNDNVSALIELRVAPKKETALTPSPTGSWSLKRWRAST